MQDLYADLRRLAGRHLRGERRNHTLQPTALVNEAYLRLMRGGSHEWRDRVHFFAMASTVMRRILVDHARRRLATKRGGAEASSGVETEALVLTHSPERILAVDEALGVLTQELPRAARVVELRFFGGLSDAETATILKVSERTVKRDWREAKARLYALLST